MPVVHLRAAARRDLIEQFVYIAENGGLEAAERFLKAAEACFDDLARQPMIGSPLKLRHPALAGMRKWRIKGFDNHLVFFVPLPDGAAIVRVLHAAQDWWRLLGLEE